ncbi:MAG: hypothetical protein ACC661_12840, partial [Verrucomicrobiales bacterium]
MKSQTKTKIALIQLGAGLALAIVPNGAIARPDPPRVSPADEEREWAKEIYEKTFSPAPESPLPTSKSQSVPILDVSLTATEVEVEFTTGERFAVAERFEIFEADARGEVILPGGNRLRLEAITLVQSHEIDWGEKLSQQIRPEWLDPLSLKLLPEEVTKGWPEEGISKEMPNQLLFRVSNSGGVPIMWKAPLVFDDRTLIRAHSRSRYGLSDGPGRFSVGLHLWHQTPLRVAVNFAFGDARLCDLKLKEGEWADFGDDGFVQVIALAPRRFKWNGWKRRPTGWMTRHQAKFGVMEKPWRTPEAGLLLYVWPPRNQQLIDLTMTGSSGRKHFYPVNGGQGISVLTLRQDPAEVSRVRVRRLPRLGRAVFYLPKIPKLQEVENLFETPIPEATIKRGYEFRKLLTATAGIQWKGASSLDKVPASRFPIRLENTSPNELIELHQELTGNPLHFDRETLSVTEQMPAG